MAQTFVRIVVDGFHADDFDFAAALQRKPATDQADFDDFISALVASEENPTDDIFWSVTIVGHSDRYDVPGASAEERRARELDASRNRRDSAFAFLFQHLVDALTADGVTAPANVNGFTNIGFCGVNAGAADLVNLMPAGEAEREQNRRVKFLILQFSPQSQTVSFGEQNLDSAVA